MRQPTPEQVAALHRFASRFGRNWKAALRHCWRTGIYPPFPYRNDAALLQQVRNELGPLWLSRYRLEE